MSNVSKSLFTIACLLCSAVLHAKSLYVDQNSSFIGPDCTKRNPCGSIIDALGVAANNDKIIVYPGWYSGSLSITQDRLKLESVTGARHTFIASDDASIIEVSGNGVTIGRSGKGFGIWKEDEDSVTNDTVGVSVTADKVKIEGNRIWLIDFVYGNGGSGAAIEVNGNQAIIKKNWIEASMEGIVISGDGRAKHQITENEMYRMQGDCIRVESNGGGKAKITKNSMSACRVVEGASRDGDSHGILVNFFGTTGKATIADNTVERTPIGFSVSGGAHLLQRNQHTIGRTAFILNDGDKPQIKDSATAFVEQAVYMNQNVTNATVSGNYLYANEILFHDRPDTSSLRSFTKNEVFRRTSGPGAQCAIAAASSDYSAEPINFSRNHWGAFAPALGSAAPDLAGDAACAATNAQTAEAAGDITFNGVFTTPPVKYKDRTPF